MPNHPNRARAGDKARNPTPAEIRAARVAAGLSAREAGEIVHTTTRVWQQWEAGDRRMHPAFWKLFRLKLGIEKYFSTRYSDFPASITDSKITDKL